MTHNAKFTSKAEQNVNPNKSKLKKSELMKTIRFYISE